MAIIQPTLICRFHTHTAIHSHKYRRLLSSGCTLRSCDRFAAHYRISCKWMAVRALAIRRSRVHKPRSESSLVPCSLCAAWLWALASPAVLKRSPQVSQLYTISASADSIDMVSMHTHRIYNLVIRISRSTVAKFAANILTTLTFQFVNCRVGTPNLVQWQWKGRTLSVIELSVPSHKSLSISVEINLSRNRPYLSNFW
jgi:hypothetical protein